MLVCYVCVLVCVYVYVLVCYVCVCRCRCVCWSGMCVCGVPMWRGDERFPLRDQMIRAGS